MTAHSNHCAYKLLLRFAVKNHPSEDCRYYVRHSSDEGESWAKSILAIPKEGCFVVNNDRLCGRGRWAKPVGFEALHRAHGCLDTVGGSRAPVG